MDAVERAATALEVGLATVVVAGLLSHRHWRVCWSFGLYLAAFVALHLPVVLWPRTFFTLRFWLVSAGTLAFLKLAVAFELYTRIFTNLPSARARTTAYVVATVVVTIAAVVPVTTLDPKAITTDVLPRVLYGTAIVFCGLLAAVLWYNVPLHSIHKAILTGFVPYLACFTLVTHALHSFGWDVRAIANYGNAIAFIGVLVYWFRASWRPYIVPDVAPEVLDRLMPWLPTRGGD